MPEDDPSVEVADNTSVAEDAVKAMQQHQKDLDAVEKAIHANDKPVPQPSPSPKPPKEIFPKA